MGSVSTSIRGVRFTLYILGGNEWVRFPRHSVSGSTLLGLTWDSWCGKGTAPGCAWCLRGHASAWISPFWRGPAPGAQRYQAVEGYLSTTQQPCDTETAVSSGLLGSPLLGTTTRCAAEWCHAWSLLGQWSGWVPFRFPRRGCGLGMDTCEESLMASKADNPTSISGPVLHMSKGPCQHSASSQVRL